MRQIIIRVLVYSSFFIISFGLTSAYAEYYLVYSQPDARCFSCAVPTNITTVRKYHKAKVNTVKVKTLHYKQHTSTHKSKRACRKLVYTAPPACVSCMPSCQTCATAVYESHRFIDFSSQPYAYHARYYTAEDYAYAKYDPDLATGDDNQMRYPDMDIDR